MSFDTIMNISLFMGFFVGVAFLSFGLSGLLGLFVGTIMSSAILSIFEKE